MKLRNLSNIFAVFAVVGLLQSCARTGEDVWDDTKSAGRHLSRGVQALGGKYGNSRQVHSRSEFEGADDAYPYDQYSYQECGQPYDYVPLQDQVNEESSMYQCQQPRETPGEHGSSIPGIEAFREPSTNPQLAGIFQNIHFEYNSNLVKGQQNLQIIHQIADYLKRHPNTYVFIEGHTDERGPQAYNLALGSRRANEVRYLLLNEGVNHDNVFTISYGKERPLIMESSEDGWAQNRRAQFKIYER